MPKQHASAMSAFEFQTYLEHDLQEINEKVCVAVRQRCTHR
jgi:hypothetical protein